MEKSKIMALYDKYAAQAEKNHQLYQETGITRYNTARRNAETLADALLIAANAAEDHSKLVHLRADLSYMASEAARLPYVAEAQKEAKTQEIINSLMSVARMAGLLVNK